MNGKLVLVVFYVLQVTSSQFSDNNEQEVLDLLNITDEELNDVMLYVDGTRAAFNAKIALKLQQLRFLLKEAVYTLELQGTQSKLNNNNADITPCLIAAQNNLTRIVLDAEFKYHDASINESVTFDPIYVNLTNLLREQKEFTNNIRLNIDECKALGSVDATNTCINDIIPTMLQQGDQVFYVIVEMRTLLGEAFDLAEDNLKENLKQIQDEMDGYFYYTEDQLATCINKLNSTE